MFMPVVWRTSEVRSNDFHESMAADRFMKSMLQGIAPEIFALPFQLKNSLFPPSIQLRVSQTHARFAKDQSHLR